MILIYTTFKNKTEAKKIITHLLKKKLIACANLLPIESTYRWKGKINNDKEIAAILKTKEENWNKIKEEIKKLHSYDYPCIIKINAEANKEFAEWIDSETS